jgi:hypothetical protein
MMGSKNDPKKAFKNHAVIRHFGGRLHLMSDWASFLTTPPAEGNVVMLRVA